MWQRQFAARRVTPPLRRKTTAKSPRKTKTAQKDQTQEQAPTQDPPR
jgi:hypothetical protein